MNLASFIFDGWYLVVVFAIVLFQAASYALALFFGLVLLSQRTSGRSIAPAVRLLTSCAIPISCAVLVALSQPQANFLYAVLVRLCLGPLFIFSGFWQIIFCAPALALGFEVLVPIRSRSTRENEVQ